MLCRSLLKSYCARHAHRISLVIYASRKVKVSPAGVKRFAVRLFRSAKDASTEEQANDAMFVVQQAILREHKYHSFGMWKFCTRVVFCCEWTSVEEFRRRRRELFQQLRCAQDDADVKERLALWLCL